MRCGAPRSHLSSYSVHHVVGVKRATQSEAANPIYSCEAGGVLPRPPAEQKLAGYKGARLKRKGGMNGGYK